MHANTGVILIALLLLLLLLLLKVEEKVYLTPSTISGCLLHPLTYNTKYSTPSNY
jgi:hypothetical protein